MKDLFKSVVLAVIISAIVSFGVLWYYDGHNPQEMLGIFYTKLQQSDIFRDMLTIGIMLLVVGFFVHFRTRYHRARRKDEERESKIEQIEKGLDIVQQTLSGLHDLIGEQNNSILAAMKGAGAVQSCNDWSNNLTSLADEIIRRLEERYSEIPFVQADGSDFGLIQAEPIWFYSKDGEGAFYIHQYLVKDSPDSLKNLVEKFEKLFDNIDCSDFSRRVGLEIVLSNSDTSAIILLNVSYDNIVGSIEEEDLREDAEKVDKAFLKSLQLLVSA